jgi:DNA-binding response OmpR family regulator
MSRAQRVTLNPPHTATVVLVGVPQKDQELLRDLFECPDCALAQDCKWAVQSKPNLHSVLSALRHEPVQVVLCDRDVVPGDWKELLDQFACLSAPPCLIVSSRLADEQLWAEALNLGAYDVLSRPFDRAEALRTICMARLQWQNRRDSRPAVMCSVA